MRYYQVAFALVLSACSVDSERSSDIIISTALHEACYRGDSFKVEKLLTKGTNINAKDGFEKAPLEWAVFGNHYRVAELLLKHGANADVKGTYCLETPLCTAVQRNYYDMAKLLLEHGANVEADDGYDRTPLGNAVINDNYDMAKLLLEHGANPNKCLTKETVSRKSILAEAIFQGNDKMIALLKKYGADINHRDEHGQTDAHRLEHVSVRNFEKLLKNGLNPAIKDNTGRTSFFYLPRSGPADYEYTGKFIKLLKKHGLNINDFTEITKNSGEYADYINPLLQAVIMGEYYLADILILNGANLKVGAWQMQSVSPLHIAAMAGDLEMVKILLKHGADVDGMHYWGITPLSSAADLGKDYPAEYEKYRKYRACGRDAATPEEYAEIVRLLLENGADVNNVEKYGNTPLHHAVQGGCEAIVRLLLQRGAKVDAINYDKESPLDLAKKLRMDNIGIMLSK